MTNTHASAQSPEQVKESLARYKTSSQAGAQLKSFYELRSYRAAWTAASAAEMTTLFAQAESLGLDSTDYHPGIFAIPAYTNLSAEDSMQRELRLSAAALHFFHHLAYGEAPVVSYDGLDYHPGCFNIPLALSTAIDNGSLASLASVVQPLSVEYRSIIRMLNQLQQTVAQPGFTEQPVTKAVINTVNKPLLKRFWQWGLLDSVPANLTAPVLKQHIKQLQQLFNLMPDGIVKQNLLTELNVPLKTRIAELKLALNTVRWLACQRATGPMIVVNIPSANLLLYDQGNVVLESRIVVGKRSTRTPTLTSRVNQVVLYPYWMVPKSIATKELLPLIKKNPGYLDANAMQVLNKQGHVVDPYSINWSSLNTSYFPYVLRQSTGCDNSLGLVKLNFYNPYNVYLHDTPWKVLFASSKRYFSHGCMRVERAMDIAHLLLKGNTIAVDTLEEKGCLLNQSPVVVPATVTAAVFVLYNTAWVDSAGRVSFSEDVYGRLNLSRRIK